MSHGFDHDQLPRVSVIMPFHNDYEFVDEAVSSILAQDYANLEVVLVNDGSQRRHVGDLAESSPVVRILQQENAGPAAARNHGLREATGDIIAFLDSDDRWPEGRLAGLLAPLLQEPDYDLVLGQVRKLVPAEQQPDGFELLGDPFHTIQLGSILARREVFDTVGIFDESLTYSEDQDWFLRARELGIPMVRVACEGLHYRIHANSLTRRSNRSRDYGLITVLRRSLKRRKSTGSQTVQSLVSISGITEWSSS